ncbi:DUF2490 domain-containing protein [Flammeovirga kamogawensis]|uniref:DUF2490 domain-containing protein n=1 Tax=Flammeovirga kamogawensis TaxID=373891 RepID=A0ABX8H0G4_9BACT|nr:DUF2490 domain-containing protein [Flammeovirga kamogawensis]MBB6462281.1 hypothetical protein [Flammeovirga kamogawensis]QWG09326.1 DUF2490 domain-containing protein [Flammeovirga kamogawensis]TRX64848.1 DUF2490 domain-containing protein [Flammeovirga kamogawensis]
MKKLFVILSLLICQLSYAQEESSSLGSWYVYNGFYQLSPKFELFFEGQMRTYEFASEPQSFFVRPFLGYSIAKNLQLGLSQEYHSNWTEEFDDQPSIHSQEYRTTFQVISKQTFGRVHLQHRYRYELRVLEDDFKTRARYRIQAGIPLSKKTMEKGVVFTTFGNEFLIDVTPALQLNQNRTYAMLGYQLTETLNIQSGYMYLAKSGHPNEHRFQLFVTQKLKFYAD